MQPSVLRTPTTPAPEYPMLNSPSLAPAPDEESLCSNVVLGRARTHFHSHRAAPVYLTLDMSLFARASGGWRGVRAAHGDYRFTGHYHELSLQVALRRGARTHTPCAYRRGLAWLLVPPFPAHCAVDQSTFVPAPGVALGDLCRLAMIAAQYDLPVKGTDGGVTTLVAFIPVAVQRELREIGARLAASNGVPRH